jgi:hypothetical protein
MVPITLLFSLDGSSRWELTLLNYISDCNFMILLNSRRLFSELNYVLKEPSRKFFTIIGIAGKFLLFSIV